MKDAIIYAGYSRLANGTMKFRTATSEKRVHQLVSFGEEVHMILINGVYSKSAAAKELLRLDHARGVKELEQFYSAQVKDENPFKKRDIVIKVPTTFLAKLTGAKPEIIAGPMSTKEAKKVRDAWNKKHAHLSYTE